MKNLLSQVINVWRGADGSTAENILDGGVLDAIASFEAVDCLPNPARPIATYLLLSDGTRSDLPFVGRAYMLLDRTGVVAIFEPGQYTKPDGIDHFPEPNNAAVFNVDGSLRFQLTVPKGALVHRIAAFHGGAMPAKWANYMGVLVATHADAPPEWVYAIDPSNPELIATGQWVRY